MIRHILLSFQFLQNSKLNKQLKELLRFCFVPGVKAKVQSWDGWCESYRRMAQSPCPRKHGISRNRNE